MLRKLKFTLWDKLLLGLLAMHFAANLVWIFVNNAPFPWDQASHASLSLQIADVIRNLKFLDIVKVSNYYPIFIHTLAAIPLLLFGPHLKLTQIVADCLFVATIGMVYVYVTEVFKDKELAFITAALFSFSPVVYNFSKWLMLDIPVVFFLFLSLYLLEKSKYLLRTKYSLLFFISAGLLMMTKWTGMLYLIIPTVLTVWNFLRKKKKRKVYYKNAAIGTILFLVINAPWYLTNWQSFLFQSSINVVGEQGAKPTDVLSIQSLTLYLQNFFNAQTIIFVSLSFFASVIYLIRKNFPYKFFIFSMLLGNYIFFTLISNKDSRYTMPLLVFTSLIIAIALKEISKKRKLLSNILTTSLTGIAFLYYAILTVRPVQTEGLYQTIILPFQVARLDIINVNDTFVKKYDPNYWSVNQALNDLASLSQNKQTTVAVGIEDEHFSPATLSTYLDAKQYNGELKNINLTTPDIYYLRSHFNSDTFPNNTSIQQYLKNTSYVLLSPKDVGTQYLRNKDALIQLRYYVIHNSLLPCNVFQATAAPLETTCFVFDGEQVKTGSDVNINDNSVTKGPQEINGFAKVYCKFGCSFEELKKPAITSYPEISIVKTYKLPDGKIVNLYKLNSND